MLLLLDLVRLLHDGSLLLIKHACSNGAAIYMVDGHVHVGATIIIYLIIVEVYLGYVRDQVV